MGEVRVKVGHFLDCGAKLAPTDVPYVTRVLDKELPLETFTQLKGDVQFLGVSPFFREIVDLFDDGSKETPAGFRVEWTLLQDGLFQADLVRDIGYEKNGVPRPTNVLFSADCCDPYEISDFKNILANITTNPVIIYDRFLTNPKANIGNKFKSREEVLTEIHRIAGSGVDISVELNNPFASDQEILAEAESFTKLIPKCCLVVKVPHFGPLNKENVSQLAEGTFSKRYSQADTKSAFRCHDVALLLKEHGYRVNFTLMFEPYQVALALQAKPYYINCFIRNRYKMSQEMSDLLACFDATGDESYLEHLRAHMVKKDYLAPSDTGMSVMEVAGRARRMLAYRQWKDQGADGLDEARDALRHLKQGHLTESKLIICSMDGDLMYPLVDKMLLEEEFRDMKHKVVISAAPEYFAQFTSAPDVLTYNRNFIRAAQKA